uniref:Uncharacterized protein n=1 Tax=Chelonoidis abingdonii TaxID=106734 RepID=A0A8C0G5U5_CHEAB
MPRAGELGFDSRPLPGFFCSGPRPSHQKEPFNPTRIVRWCSCCSSLPDLGWVNNPTLGEFCFTMIGRVNCDGSNSDITMNAWQPQGSYPCGNFSEISCPSFMRRPCANFPYIVLTCQKLFTLEICSPGELTRSRQNCDTFQGLGPSLGANPFQGVLPFTKKREVSPRLPLASLGSVVLPHWMPRGIHLCHSGLGDLNQDPFLSAEGKGAYLSLRTD